MEPTKVKVSELVLDYDLWVRLEARSVDIRDLVEALEAGATLPPIVADKKTKRVVDGFHRVKAHLKLYGPNALIPVILKEYASEQDMLLDAIRLNSEHGRKFSPYDRARCLAKAQELGIDIGDVAKAMNMTVEALGKLKAERLGYFHSKPIVLKRTISHLAGDELTEEQVAYNRQAGGSPPTFFVNQVIRMLESNSVDWDNEKLVSGLKRLYSLLEQAFKVKV